MEARLSLSLCSIGHLLEMEGSGELFLETVQIGGRDKEERSSNLLLNFIWWENRFISRWNKNQIKPGRLKLFFIFFPGFQNGFWDRGFRRTGQPERGHGRDVHRGVGRPAGRPGRGAAVVSWISEGRGRSWVCVRALTRVCVCVCVSVRRTAWFW